MHIKSNHKFTTCDFRPSFSVGMACVFAAPHGFPTGQCRTQGYDTINDEIKFANIEFEVPPAYPMQMVKFTLKEHNFNSIFAQMFESHTQNIIKRLWGGGQPGYDPNEKVDVKGFPTLKYYKNGNAIDYNGARDLESLQKFAMEQLDKPNPQDGHSEL